MIEGEVGSFVDLGEGVGGFLVGRVELGMGVGVCFR